MEVAKILNIKSCRSLKITRIQNWNVFFTVDGQNYLLHGSDNDGEERQDLYLRTINEFGNYNLEFMCFNYFTSRIRDFYFNDQSGSTIVYKFINKKKFIANLVVSGLAESDDPDVKFIVSEIKRLKETISHYEESIKRLAEGKRKFENYINKIVKA